MLDKIEYHAGIVATKTLVQKVEYRNSPCEYPCRRIEPQKYDYPKYTPSPKSKCFTPGSYKGSFHDRRFVGMKVNILDPTECNELIDMDVQTPYWVKHITCTEWANTESGPIDNSYLPIRKVSNKSYFFEKSPSI